MPAAWSASALPTTNLGSLSLVSSRNCPLAGSAPGDELLVSRYRGYRELRARKPIGPRSAHPPLSSPCSDFLTAQSAREAR
ncbi:MAG: hypothetical protein JWR37_3186 [Mycobacterium sp.]|nr:hypothetical protein [Mycobacterium sp.]